MSMNIYAQKGHKVVFCRPFVGRNYEESKATNHLNVGGVYTIDRTVIHDWHTDVYLQEVPSVSFNSAHFDDYTENSLPPAA